MVSSPSSGRDRAQLILVGCVAIALVIVSVTLVINTSLYTENAAPALTNEQVEDARTYDLETRKGVRSLVHRVNHAQRYDDESALEADLTDAIASFDGLMTQAYARSEPARVSVSYDHDDSETGARFVKSADGEFTSGDVMDSTRTIGWFSVNVDVANTSEGDSGSFRAIVRNDSRNLRLDVYRNGSANVTVESRLDGTTRKTTCNSIRGRVLIDVYAGDVVADECTGSGAVDGVSDLEGPYEEIEFRNGDAIRGRYNFVIDERVHWFNCGGADPDDPCWTPAVWTANLTTTFRGDGIDYHNERDVTIYTTD